MMLIHLLLSIYAAISAHRSVDGVDALGFSHTPTSSVRHGGRRYSKTASLLNAPQKSDALSSSAHVQDVANKKTTQHKRQRIPVLSYKDDYVIVSKPAGMTMHHNSNSRWGRSKQPVLETTIKKQLSRKPFLVHRLDHRTSGALLLAFDSETAGKLHGRLRQPDATKLYVALVRGDLRDKFQIAAAGNNIDEGGNYIDLSVGGDGSVIGSSGRIPLLVDGDNKEKETKDFDFDARSEYNSKITVNLPIKIDGIEKESHTDFFFLSSINLVDEGTDDDITEGPYVTKSLSLLLCRPKTGRTHQIRRHAVRALQSPIIGDSEHGDSRVNRFWRERIGFNRLGLHCFYLMLPSLQADDEISCIAPVMEDFKSPLQCDELSMLWREAERILPSLQLEPYDERGGTFGRHYRKSNH
jgi:tRNA pseudouridine65 synthase